MLPLLVSTAFAATMSVPSEENPAYTFEAPADWKPVANDDDESVEANSHDQHAYLCAWVVSDADISALSGDVEAMLKDSMKEVDDATDVKEFKSNGVDFTVIQGSGVDKREGNKVKFLVAIFPAGGGKAGIVFADWDADAPADITSRLQKMFESIKVKA